MRIFKAFQKPARNPGGGPAVGAAILIMAGLVTLPVSLPSAAAVPSSAQNLPHDSASAKMEANRSMIAWIGRELRAFESALLAPFSGNPAAASRATITQKSDLGAVGPAAVPGAGDNAGPEGSVSGAAAPVR